jgi:2-polyprenyl-3-methyl-5-hydroxy-6-metoxy-1,4-benzoquinol methylase
VPDPSSIDVNDFFASTVERDLDDRQRLERQFGLLRDDFNLWYDAALRAAGLPTDPARATWSVLDVGCGEGLFTREIVRRYPRARAVGIDADADAIAVAAAHTPDGVDVRYQVHDISHPVADGAGFDVIVMWMVLPYLPDRKAVLANLAAVLRPGGTVLLGNVPDRSLHLDHPAAEGLLAAGQQLVRRLRLDGLQDSLAALLHEVGFDDLATETLRYPMGGATSQGQRWYAYMLTAMATARRPIVDVFELMDAAEYDRRFARLAAEPVLRLRGEVRFLVTVARRRKPSTAPDSG